MQYGSSNINPQSFLILDDCLFDNSWVKDRFRWLSTTDIEKVLKQYEKKYPDFKNIGPTPIDFDQQHEDGQGCVMNELCRVNLHQLFQKLSL